MTDTYLKVEILKSLRGCILWPGKIMPVKIKEATLYTLNLFFSLL